MFSNALIALMVGAGAGAWAYSKTMHSTSNNTKSSLTVAGVCFGITFLVVVTLLSMLIKK